MHDVKAYRRFKPTGHWHIDTSLLSGSGHLRQPELHAQPPARPILAQRNFHALRRTVTKTLRRFAASLGKLLGGAAIGCWLTGCGITPTVYAVNDTMDAKATGGFDDLSKLMGPARNLRVIFVHGVSDHCPGYALSQDDGWLNSKALDVLHLRPTDGLNFGTNHLPRQEISTRYFDPKAEPRAVVVMAKRQYVLDLQGESSTNAGPVKVEAIEITWSPLTQWVKRQQLAYDAMETMASAPCTAVAVDPYAGVVPPPRKALNRRIKESTLDLSLADAILYVGSYGQLIERGVAEALCHGVTDTPPDQTCHWPTKEQAESDPYRYMFVTHSLGSRIVYDLLLNLQGIESTTRNNQLSDETIKDAQFFTTQLVGKLNGIYMMANQLSILGLANFDPHTLETQGPQPTFHGIGEIELNGPRASGVSLMSGAPESKTPQSPNIGPSKVALFKRTPDAPGTTLPYLDKCDQPFQVLAYSREVQMKALRDKSMAPKRPLNVIAFNDSNDLLTWHLPSWYSSAGTDQSNCKAAIEIENVFLTNTAWLPALLEIPTTAHSGYFKNEAVWQAIACGAKDGALKACFR